MGFKKICDEEVHVSRKDEKTKDASPLFQHMKHLLRHPTS